MFAALGRFVTRFPWYVVGAWVVFAVLVVSFAPKLESTSDSASFLPKHYESIRAADIKDENFPTQGNPGAILVFTKADGGKLTAEDSTKVADIVGDLVPELDAKVFSTTFSEQLVQPVSPDGKVQIAVVNLAEDANGFDQAGADAAKELRKDAKALLEGTDLELQTTGTAPQQLDNQDSGETALLIVGIATVVLIVVLLGLIFRSVLICLLPVVAVGGVLSPVATGLIAWANEAFDLKADSSVEQILVVVLFGIGTDYILFLLFRYREALRRGLDSKAAMVDSMERAGEAIASAGGAVIVAFMALILSSLSIFRSIGPALAIAVAVTLVAALTLIPALITLLGGRLFWPSKNWAKEPEGARFGAVGASLGKHPGRYAVASGAVLAVLAVFALSFNPTFDFSASLPKGAESTEALETLQKSLPSGSTDPATVMLVAKDGGTVTQAQVDELQKGIGTPKGAAQVTPGAVSESGKAGALAIVLDDDPGSDAAIANVKGPIRDAVHAAAPEGTRAYIGGNTSVFVDMDRAMARDYSVVFPVAAGIILVILALLLRSLVAPLYLMASVGLGFGATVGASALLFQNIKGDEGLFFLLPIYIYLFVVALGTDYNILMIARLREEARAGKSSRDAAAEAIKHAGPTIGAAGIILSGTFASLMLGGNSLIVSMGFALSFGIFVSAFVMAMFFTPAITALIGHAAWWPGHGDETDEEHFARTGEHYSH
ncbi:RND superfamily putative drug exporter [Marmoricola sp. OAE513]|uniref:MMPL family transporter n=1 Tax=Marmoricola sp. OAE513 TaxID=2817894 RepID=UPI001AE6E403